MSEKQHGELTQLMMKLFPATSQRHLRAYEPEAGQRKNVLEIKRRAGSNDYAQHLDPSSWDVVGSLGLMPGILSGTIWRTPWAVMDFDEATPTDLADFFSVLTQHGLVFTVSHGTTGRGAHVWFFLDEAVTLKQAYKTLAFLKRAAKKQGHIDIHLRPVAASGKGVGIMLPYRGAAQDGLGANPLYSPLTGAQLDLWELAAAPLQSAKAFVKLGNLKSVEKFLARVRPKERPKLTSRLPSVLDDPSLRWNFELKRLNSLWQEGRRHYLTVAVTAYGVDLGIDPDTIRDDVMDLVESCNDEQAADREQAIEAGLKRQEAGEMLNAAHFYEEADVELPRAAELAEVRELLDVGVYDLMSQPWPGKAGKTDRSLYKALLYLAWEYGILHPEGVELSVAWSQLNDEANVASSNTLGNSLGRLEAAGLLSRAKCSFEGKSGSFVLLVTKRSILLRGGQDRECFGLSPALRNGGGALGKTREQIVDLLIWCGLPQTREDLASSMATRWQDLNEPLSTLVSDQIVHERGSGRGAFMDLVDNWRDLLERRQRSDGSTGRREGQREEATEKSRRYRKHIIAQQVANSQPLTANDDSPTSSPSSSAT
ncbi:hypothetical protein EHF33_12290 [Deinococcus psychrotolerans]|uniref:TOTE conflict system primase domain-containing protein n=1 Tax=Deinococcus psychrotolerans TaxID=2489213 RepID=A0A3G8YDK3_9DEIO|nr:hypothetical protein [Deinococcus psychrotolerans]AZI43428.1 hypothetical protein EHF33_12290 [Deinococcus psychrotolerans]